MNKTFLIIAGIVIAFIVIKQVQANKTKAVAIPVDSAGVPVEPNTQTMLEMQSEVSSLI